MRSRGHLLITSCLALWACAAFASSASAAPGEIPGKGFLPDNRGWELVSTGDNAGYNLDFTGSHTATGNSVALRLRGVAPGSQAGNIGTTLLAERDPVSGWRTSPYDTTDPAGAGWGFYSGPRSSPTAAQTILLSGDKLTADAHELSEQLYLRDNALGTYKLLTPLAQPNLGVPLPASLAFSRGAVVVGGAPGFRSVAYDLTFPQVEGVALNPFSMNSYEWVDGQGVRLVGVLPESSCGAPPCIPPEGTRIGNGGISVVAGNRYLSDFVSRDGNRIFFFAIEPGSDPGTSEAGQLYVRQGGTETIHVSASQRTDCAGDPTCGGDGEPDPAPDPAGPLPAMYLAADQLHGDRVLFMGCEKLTDDSHADSTDEGCNLGGLARTHTGPGLDLYLFDVDSRTLTDVTAGDPAGGDLVGLVGASDDLSRFYFVASGDLAPGATRGHPNLYLWEEGALDFVATLTDDADPVGSDVGEVPSDVYLSRSFQPQRSVMVNRTSSDGRFLLFVSRARLAGYDNTNPSGCPTRETGPLKFNLEGRCAEVYLYDALTRDIRCLSCGPPGDSSQNRDAILAPPSEGFPSAPEPLNLVDDGSRAFFETAEPLVGGDTNGKVDVYEWTANGVSLISSGQGTRDSHFVDADPIGDDVFFNTYDRLTGSDRNDTIDTYDARVDGGFPAAQAPVPCAASACQGEPSPPSVLSAPGSERAGAGNPPRRSVACKAPKKRVGGRCVKKKVACKHKASKKRVGVRCVKKKADKHRRQGTARPGVSK